MLQKFCNSFMHMFLKTDIFPLTQVNDLFQPYFSFMQTYHTSGFLQQKKMYKIQLMLL